MREVAGKARPQPVCGRCGKPLEKIPGGPDQQRLYCSSCMIRLAEQNIPDKVRVLSAPSKKRHMRMVAKWTLVIGCSAFILVNSVMLVKFLVREKSKDFVPPDMSKDAILCMSNLSDISELLQEGRLPPDSIVCPISGQPYQVEVKEGDVIVSCPNPESHLLYGLRVSKKDPVPKVVR